MSSPSSSQESRSSLNGAVSKLLFDLIHVPWWRTPIWVLALSVVPGAVIAAIIQLQPWIPVWPMLADPVIILNGEWYTGLVTYVSALLWWTAASVCTCAAVACLDGAKRRFLLGAGFFSALLGWDDLFMGHEVFWPHFGIPGDYVIPVYGLLILVHLIAAAPVILRTEAAPLALAMGMLFGATLIEFTPLDGVFEDYLELCGLIAWVVYHVRVSWRFVQEGRSAA